MLSCVGGDLVGFSADHPALSATLSSPAALSGVDIPGTTFYLGWGNSYE